MNTEKRLENILAYSGKFKKEREYWINELSRDLDIMGFFANYYIKNSP